MANLVLQKAAQTLSDFDDPQWRAEIRRLTPADLSNLLSVSLARLREAVKSLEDRFESKGEILELMCISAIAQEPMLIFGQPGTAKSDLVARFAESLGVRRFENTPAMRDELSPPAISKDEDAHNIYFEYLLNEYTEPDELLGPVVVGDLVKNPPSFRRFRQGALSEAHVVFLDEIFRGNSAILNALLSLINERRIYEAGKVIKANLFILFGAANHPPISDELSAFYERFAIRVVSAVVGNEDGRRERLLKKAWVAETEKLNAAYDPFINFVEQKACLNDLLVCNRAITEMWGGADFDKHDPIFRQDYIHIVNILNNDKRRLCRIDDRKFVKIYKLLRAKALYAHQGPPVIDDLKLLKHTWVDFESQIPLQNLIDSEIEMRKKLRNTQGSN